MIISRPLHSLTSLSVSVRVDLNERKGERNTTHLPCVLDVNKIRSGFSLRVVSIGGCHQQLISL